MVAIPREAQSTVFRLRLVRQEPDFVALAIENVLVLSWGGPQDPAVCRSLYDAAVDVAATSGTGRVAILSIVSPGCTAPSKEAREALSQLHDDPKQVVHRSAMVFRSDSVISGAVRRIAMGIMQRGNRRLKHDVFSHLDRALTWVTDGLPTPSSGLISVPDVVAALEEYLSTAQARSA